MISEMSDAMRAWRSSERWRAIASESARRNLRRFAEAPRCGAKRRNGEPCRKPGTGNGGRCRLHGGRTPKGADWHRPVWPTNAEPHVVERKLQRKLEALRKKQLARQRIVAAMTPERRARYEQWLQTHEPTTPRRRAEKRARRRSNADLRVALERSAAAPVTPELAEVERRIAELRDALAESASAQAHEDMAIAETEPEPGPGLNTFTEGIFG